ncbi:MAG: phosphoenolpyruvate carboxykinase (ATP) [Haloferacaceae archaeon]
MATEGEMGVTVTDFPDPRTTDHVIYGPSFDDLRAFSADQETTTEYGSPAYVTDYHSRSSDSTRNDIDHEFDAADYAVVEEGLDAVREGEREFVCVDRRVGRHPESSYVCRLFVPKPHARIALAWAKLLDPVEGDPDPDFVTVQLPDRDEPSIRALIDEGVTVVLGSDYTGEAKKSFLRLFMRRAKEQGGLGLHAGSKRIHLDDEDGDARDVGQLFLGLSGTGKSTLTSHGLWLDDPEYAEAVQDDVCALLPDGTVAGSEGGGLYIKTLGLDPGEQPELYSAATAEDAVLENVVVADDGAVDFDDDTLSGNARAVVTREQVDGAAEGIDLERVDQLFFITRHPLVPPLARLSPEQAAAAFMLGESAQTSAVDPSAAGETVRVVGTNPFIVGPEGAEGNRFRDLVDDLDISCYLLNTGEVGTGDPRNVSVEETVALLTAVARGEVAWTDDPTVGLTVATDAPGVDLADIQVTDRVDDPAEFDAVRSDRRDHLAAFDELDDRVLDAVY